MNLPPEIDLAAFDTMEDAVLVDCRTPEERLEAAIADQAFVPMDEASARIEDFKFIAVKPVQTILGTYPQSAIIVLDNRIYNTLRKTFLDIYIL